MKIRLGLSLLAAALFATASMAQEKIPAFSPNEPIIIVTASGPGTGPDAMAHAFMEVAAKHTDQKYVIEYRVGAAAALAFNFMMDRPHDGKTMLLWTRSFSLRHIAQPHLPNPLDVLHFVGILLHAPSTVFTYADNSPYADATKIFEECKASPGKLQFAIGWPGSLDWLIANMIFQQTGCEAQAVPFDDGATQAAAVMGKHISLAVGDMGDVISRPRLLPVIVTTAEPDPRVPNAKTMVELGYNIVEGQHRGFALPADAPDAAKEFAGKVYEAVVNDPDWAKWVDSQRFVLGGGGTDEMVKIVSQTIEAATPIFAAAGIPAKQ